jgi:hypothetical protein
MKTRFSIASLFHIFSGCNIPGFRRQVRIYYYKFYSKEYNSVPNFVPFLQCFAKFDCPELADLASSHLCTVIQIRILYLNNYLKLYQ